MTDNPQNQQIFFALEVMEDLTKIREAAVAFVLAERLTAHDIFVSIAGYDDDPRELWTIPEVVKLVKRWHQMCKEEGAKFNRLETISRAVLLAALGRAIPHPTPDGNYRFEITGDF